uniref:Uncharacterized protein n=1 Tax=Oryza brachyantha TaxID=4533 RepID=J3KYF5_ORYBR
HGEAVLAGHRREPLQVPARRRHRRPRLHAARRRPAAAAPPRPLHALTGRPAPGLQVLVDGAARVWFLIKLCFLRDFFFMFLGVN